jgi:hypothetical protein
VKTLMERTISRSNDRECKAPRSWCAGMLSLKFQAVITVAFSFLCLNSLAYGQGQFSMRCSLASGNVAIFGDGGIKQERLATDTLSIVYDQVDKASGKGRMIGNNGATDVSAIFSGADRLHLIELTQVGNLNLMTIFDVRRIFGGGSSPAVYSRHVALGRGEAVRPAPSQYYGSCVALN